MTAEFLQKYINKECCNFNVIVLKGFSPDLICKLGESFTLIDDYVINDGKIVLEETNGNHLMISILSSNPWEKVICTCESFIEMCTHISDLDILKKQICVLDNNLLEMYPNPSNADIPDFDSETFQDTDGDSALYSLFYSFCICEDGVQYIEYIDNYSSSKNCLSIKKIADPKPYKLSGDINSLSNYKQLSTKDGSLAEMSKRLYYSMQLVDTKYAVEAEEVNEENIRAFVAASEMMGFNIEIYQITRDLNMYKDLSVNHDVISVSQGSIIENVVQQAEHAYNSEVDKVNNVLLTSPTGAGKSLLFQLSAIYLAEKYGLLTIVVSPLVALMNDQVEGLTGYDAVATLNSNKTATEKEYILENIKNGQINILYLSPELLLSYSIKSFIGDKKLGLLVVDEAHTVTTWGRDFRVDYWFLGDYLRKAKRILKYPFPIFALTATAVWDPSGKNDMVFDTIRSLNMDPCVKYIGVVRRTNISFEIGQSLITNNYEEKRKQLTIKRIREALVADRKTIVYFPFRRTVDGIVLSDDVDDIKDKLARYHAQLFPEDKTINAEDFRTGKRPIMCATKAFGMGIDVSDIKEVYHHAPTGCLSDYVQEIGRLARDPKIKGIAKIDFSPNDFRYIRKLHGLSAIKPYQLMQVLKKLMAIYRINGEKRNMLISSSDFNYIFPLSTPDDVDQNLKSCLLLISNDLLNKLRFHALIVRPKSLFSKCFVEVPDNQTKDFYRLYYKYLKHITDCVYILDADSIWMEKYNSISFPKFKFKLADGKVFNDFDVALRNKVTLCLNDKIESVRLLIEEFFTEAHGFLDYMCRSRHRVSFNEMKSKLPKSFDSLKREQFLETFRMLYATDRSIVGATAAFCNIYTQKDGVESFQLMQSGYETIKNSYLVAYDKLIRTTELIEYCDPKDTIVTLSEFLNSLGVADYQRTGGDQPAIFVRINNPYYLNSLISSKNYRNDILESIYEKYRFSERIFTYFFTTPMTDNQRWDFIEAYFLGASENELLNFV